MGAKTLPKASFNSLIINVEQIIWNLIIGIHT
jgi:hypothetical protein